MNTTEKTFYYAAMAMLCAGVVLFALHLAEPRIVVMLLTSGMGLLGVVAHGCMRRLKARNHYLQLELLRLRASE